MLVNLFWSLWPDVPAYGTKSSQFVDLLGYFSLKSSQNDDVQWAGYAEKAMALLSSQVGYIFNLIQFTLQYKSNTCIKNNVSFDKNEKHALAQGQIENVTTVFKFVDACTFPCCGTVVHQCTYLMIETFNCKDSNIRD